MEFAGKLTEILPEQTGQGKNGTWKKISFVLETQDQYPKKACFDAWSEKADQMKAMPIGSVLNVGFDIESREFNGKWYTNLKAWKIELQKPSQSGGVNSSLPSELDVPAPEYTEQDDLPF